MSISQKPDIAAARVKADGTLAGSASFGIQSVVKNGGNGSYTIVTSQAFDPSSVIRMAVIGGAANANIQDVPNVDGVTHAITTSVGAVATDEAFSFEIERVVT